MNKVKYKVNYDNSIDLIDQKSVKRIMFGKDELSWTKIDGIVKTESLTWNQLININKVQIIFKDGSSTNLEGTMAIKQKKYNKHYSDIYSDITVSLTSVLGWSQYERVLRSYNSIIKNKGNYRIYTDKFETAEIDPKIVLVESLNTNDLSSVMIPIIKRFIKDGYKVSVVVNSNSSKVIESKLVYYKLNVGVVNYRSKSYYRRLLTAKYLVNDSTFFRSFVKREGQVYINPWHGTPLKKMGYDMPNHYETSNNIQRNMFNTNLFLQTCDYGKQRMEGAYHFDQIEVMGNPKMDILFDPSRNQTIRHELGIDKQKKVVVFTPTWRGTAFLSKELDPWNFRIFDWLTKIEQDDIVVFYKAHQSVKGIYSEFSQHLQEIPAHYDINDFLNVADVLVTDYSSIMFDFAIKNKPILLYAPDVEEYSQTRGLYMPLEDLPFKIIRNERELIKSIIKVGPVADYSKFNLKYNPLENGGSTSELFNKIYNLKETERVSDKKEVLIYPGGLVTNGITTAFYGLLNELKKIDNVEFYIHLPVTSRMNMDVAEFSDLPSHIKLICSPGGTVRNGREWRVYRKLIENQQLTQREQQTLHKDVMRERMRLFGKYKFDYYINFSGYERYLNYLYTYETPNSSLYVHNDMRYEAVLKRNINVYSMMSAYEQATNIVPISEELVELMKTTFYDSDKYKLCRNCFSTERVQRIANEVEFEFNNEYDKQITYDKSITKFINIARFSPEKSQARLIEAYDRIKPLHPNVHLFLVGTKGSEYETIMELTKNRDDISVYTNINPFTLLKNSDLFVLSSFYEGLPMTFFESIAFNIPILSTDMPSPTRFLKEGYGITCENSVDGLESSLLDYMQNGFKIEKNISSYNELAINDFLKIIEEK